MNQKIIIANFKNFLTLRDERTYLQVVATLQTSTAIQLLVAPSLLNLSYAVETLQTKFVIVGQSCSPSADKTQTGGIRATSLAEAGAAAVLIGHHETRKLYNWQQQELVQCIQQAVAAGLFPIICIGEATSDNEDELRFELQWLKKALAICKVQKAIIAYEPLFAIGRGATVTADYLRKRLALIKEYIPVDMPVLYGGSVTAATYEELMTTEISGFLIGSASTHFQELEKIVSYR